MCPVRTPFPLHGWLLGSRWPAEDKRAPGGNSGPRHQASQIYARYMVSSQPRCYLNLLWGN